MTPVAAPTPDTRAAFEAWYARYKSTTDGWVTKIHGLYVAPEIEQAWYAWTAALATSAEREAAMQKRAEAAEDDWQKAESALAESERRRKAAEKVLAEADWLVAQIYDGDEDEFLPAGTGPERIKLTVAVNNARRRHAARAKEGT